jgi:hypothetical protein
MDQDKTKDEVIIARQEMMAELNKATLRRALVVLVGAFPPPLHEMAAVNAAVRKEARGPT